MSSSSRAEGHEVQISAVRREPVRSRGPAAANQVGHGALARAVGTGGGVRWTAGRNRRVGAYGQMILGVERDTTAIEQFGSDSVANLLVRPGAGINVRVGRWQDLFGQVDIRRVFREGDTAKAFDFLVGVRFSVR